MSSLSAVFAQRRVLSETAHRPWGLPDRGWFMGQTWRHLLFAHWPVEPEALREVVPPQLPLDLREGAAWLAITPFLVEGFHLRWLPPPPLVASFSEVNVRTYVTVSGKRGIYFLSLDASSRLAVAGARRTYRLPYFRSEMTLTRPGGPFRIRSNRISADGPPAALDCEYAPVGEVLPAREDTLERWLTERYCLYTLDSDGVIQRGEIHHPPWPLRRATAELATNTMTAPYGIRLDGEPLLHFAERQDVVLWTIEPVAD